MTEETQRQDDVQQPATSRDRLFAAILLAVFIIGVIVPLAYFLYTVVLPGIAAGFAQFSLTGNTSYPGPFFR